MSAAPPPASGPRRRAEFWAHLPACTLYFLLALPLTLHNLERLNPDGVAYLRLAGYWAHGPRDAALSLYWSPLFPLCIAPLELAGCEGVEAARIVLLLAGALLLAGTAGMLRAWTPAGAGVRAALLLGAAPGIASLQIGSVAPDLLLSALLVAAFALLPWAARSDAAAPRIVLGLLMGLAFWAKSYALPFGLLHLPLSLWWLRRGTGRPVGGAILQALAGFLVAVLPLCAALSWKAGAFTVGKSGPINHAVVGPADVPRYHPVVWGVPAAPHLSVWETPDRLPYRFWSPFESGAYFRHQVGIVTGNAASIARALTRLDFAWLAPLALLGLLAVALLPRAIGPPRTTAAWVAGTMLLYAGGYLPVAFENRYLLSLALPLSLIALASWIALAPARLGPGLAVVAMLSFFAGWAAPVERDLQASSPIYLREAAAALQKAGLRGPFAATSWPHGIALAYYTGEVHAGFPPEADPAQVARTLRSAGVRWIVLIDTPLPPSPVQDAYLPTLPRARAVIEAEGWIRRADLRIRRDDSIRDFRIQAYERPGSAGE